MKFGRKYNENNVNDWLKRYNELKSVEKVGKEFGVAPTTIWKRLKNAGIKISKTKYSFSEDFFSNDTPESFYWAGFIAADGCIKERGGSVELCIALARTDLSHLEKFKKAILFTGPIINEESFSIRYNSLRKSSRITLTITKTKSVDGLHRFGITPRKSSIYIFPKWIINHELVNHFMRGYFDGDGSFFIRPGACTNHLNFNVCGTIKFLEEYKSILVNKCSLKNNKIYDHTISDKIFYITYSGNTNVFKIRDFLYLGATSEIYLERKFSVSHGVSLSIVSRNKSRFRGIIGVSLKDSKDIVKIDAITHAKNFGFSVSCIISCCKGKRKQHKGYTWKYTN